MYSQSQVMARKRKLVAVLAQEEAKERARRKKQGGAIVLLALGLSKNHKFRIIMDEKEDDEETPQLFIVV